MDFAPWLLIAALVVVTLAGVRWRRVRVPGAILIAAISLCLLEIMPSALARTMVVDIANTACAECRDEILYPMIDKTRGAARTIMVPVTVLGIWAAMGDYWSQKGTGGGVG